MWKSECGNYDHEDGEIFIVNPDVTLPYIDDKISGVLGQFQKNYGAGVMKDGSMKRLDQYGSFLPARLHKPFSFSEELLRDNSVPVVSAVDVCGEKISTCNFGFTAGELIPSDRLSEKKNKPESLKVRIKLGSDKLLSRSNSTMDIHQIVKKFEVSAGPMISPLPEYLLCLKETECKNQKEYEFEDKCVSVKHKKINPCPIELKGVKLIKLKDNHRVSEECPVKTQEFLACKDQFLSAREIKKVSGKKCHDTCKNLTGSISGEWNSVPTDPLAKEASNGINDSTVQDHVISDNWVCCDKCQKWRLLPHDAKPNLLPKKWICSMINWLPGMNKCSFSQDATTEALHAFYNLPPENLPIKYDQNKDQSEDSVDDIIHMTRPFKIKRQVIIDDDSLDGFDEFYPNQPPKSLDHIPEIEHLEGEICKPMIPGPVEGERKFDPSVHKIKIKVNPQQTLSDGLSSKHAASDFSQHSCKEQVPPDVDGTDQMLSPEKKRKMNFREVNGSMRNGKKPKFIKKDKKISSLVESVFSTPQRISNSEVVEAKSNAARKNCSSEESFKPVADSILCVNGKLKRKLGGGTPQISPDSRDDIEMGFSLIDEDTQKMVEQPKQIHQNKGGTQITIEVDLPNFIKNGVNHSTISDFKEAIELKNHADRMKAEGLKREGTTLCFEAALNFFRVASLLEQIFSKNGNFMETCDRSISLYSYTAKLCGLCAQEYEKYNEMTLAALAYKCMEVTFMKVVFLKHSAASKEQQELKRFLGLIPSEDSPSYSSDLDSLTGQCNSSKTPQSRENILRLLSMAHDTDHAMEASTKSFIAFDHARAHLESSHKGHNIISSLKRVLDFSFHDIDGLLCFIRIAMDAIRHP